MARSPSGLALNAYDLNRLLVGTALRTEKAKIPTRTNPKYTAISHANNITKTLIEIRCSGFKWQVSLPLIESREQRHIRSSRSDFLFEFRLGNL